MAQAPAPLSGEEHDGPDGLAHGRAKAVGRLVNDIATAAKVVLVVDDNESVVALAARILDREGYDVLTATDGTTALELFSRHGPSLAAVVLDVTMPGMSGDELFLELVRRGLTAPVIVSSGFAAEEVLRRFDLRAVAGFLQKPYRSQELVDIVRSAVGHRA